MSDYDFTPLLWVGICVGFLAGPLFAGIIVAVFT